MIELDDIHKAFNQGQPNEYWALSGISLTVAARQVTALSGPSGSGKTTLLTLLGCLARPTQGRVRLRDEDVSGLPERFLTEIRRRTFGFVFQQFNLVRGLSALDNVMLPAYPLGLPYGRTARKGRKPAGRTRSRPPPQRARRMAFRRRTAAGGDRPGTDQRSGSASSPTNPPPISIRRCPASFSTS